MKILHFYKKSYPSSYGGVEQVIHNLARASEQRGVTCDVLSLSANKRRAVEEVDGL